MTFAARLDEVRQRIASVGDADRVRIVAVTKGFDESAVLAARAHGLLDVGENYAQEARAKHDMVDAADLRWHFIGRLQRNKVRHVADFVHLWQSVDDPRLASEIAKRAPGAAILLQVDLAGVPGRGGCAFENVGSLLDHARNAGLDVRGLMGVGPAGPPEAARSGFRRLRETADALGLPEVSMGMSADIEVAVEEGATMVRAGSALFGARTYG